MINNTNNLKRKAALISIGLNFAFTISKFVLYAFSGSLAILADAWHSMSDVVTSLMVLLAVSRTPKKQELTVRDVETTEGESQSQACGWRLWWRKLYRGVTFEHLTALGIALFITLTGLSLLWEVFYSTKEVIDQPLLSGLLFFVFALGSYFVYSYETSIGQQTGSVGLISDGLHSKADMLSSMLAGASLILYVLGIDIDRPMAAFIALFILSFGIETLIGTVIAVAQNQPGAYLRWRTLAIIGTLLSKRQIKTAAQLVEGASGAPVLLWLRKVRAISGWVFWGLLVLIAGWWIATCVFIIGPSDQAFIERFGHPVQTQAALGPGWHGKYPWPIDRVVQCDTCTIRRLNVGNVQDETAFALLWTQEHGSEEEFLSGDNHFFFPYLTIHYRISDIFCFILQQANPEQLLDDVAHNHISRIFAGHPFDGIIGANRTNIERELTAVISQEMSALECGIEIIGVHFRDVHPPIVIAGSFEQVIAARQLKEQLINEAHGYRNRVMPERRGDAERRVQGAQAYANERIMKATGEAARFLLRRPSSEEFKVTLRRLYYESLVTALSKAQSLLVDPELAPPALVIDPSGSRNAWSSNPGSAYSALTEPTMQGNQPPRYERTFVREENDD